MVYWFSTIAVTERWVETHLMDVVNRSKANQAIAAPDRCTDLRTGFVTQNTHVLMELMNICTRCLHMPGNSGAQSARAPQGLLLCRHRQGNTPGR